MSDESDEQAVPRNGKPIPAGDGLWAPFWQAAGQGSFVVQQCRSCGHLQFPAKENCATCLAADLEWVPVSGEGTVYSYVVYHQTWTPGYKEDVPYNVSIIELPEGVRLISNVVGVEPDDLHVGLPVVVCFEGLDDDRAVPHFQPLAS
jgi:uncharacterized OB-fold protein